MCNAVLCIVADLNKTGDQRMPVISIQREFEAPYGNIGANCGYAMIAHRHMHEYGTTPQQMAKVAVDHAPMHSKNPLATSMTSRFTIDDVLNSKMIVDPLHLYEIVSPVSGGAAIIVASPEVARRAKNRRSGCSAPASMRIIRASLCTVGSRISIKPAAEAAFQNGGTAAQGHGFRLSVRLLHNHGDRHARNAGFCKKGQGGPFVMEHNLTYAGDFPAIRMGPVVIRTAGPRRRMSHVTEAIRQLMAVRRAAGEKRGACYVNGNADHERASEPDIGAQA